MRIAIPSRGKAIITLPIANKSEKELVLGDMITLPTIKPTRYAKTMLRACAR